MAEKMTLGMVRDTLASWLGGSEACLDTCNVALLESMVSACDAHIAQPAQAVDVAERIRAKLPTIRARTGNLLFDAGTHDACEKIEVFLTRAIGNAQAEGWRDAMAELVDQWRIRASNMSAPATTQRLLAKADGYRDCADELEVAIKGGV